MDGKEAHERGRRRVRRRPAEVRAEDSTDSRCKLDHRRNRRWGRAQPHTDHRLHSACPVERRIKALEERPFEQRRFVLGYAGAGEDAADPAHHPPEPGPVESHRPVAADPRPQTRGAPDVEQTTARVD